MEKGILTNTWFSVLDSSRVYDATLLISAKGVILENDSCEHLETRFKEKNYGFNIQQEKKKLKV